MSFRAIPIRAWSPVFLWMLLIFIGSTDVLSSRHTSRFIGPFLHWLKPDISDERVQQIQYFVRKCGHVSEYAVLAILTWRALHVSAGIPWRVWNWRMTSWTLGIAILYAASDEFHQSFVATRYASVLDVLIDTMGAACGLALMGVVCRAAVWTSRVQVQAS